MFTGIVQGMAEVVAIEERPEFFADQVRLPQGLEQGLETGASVAHNGCCLTVTALEGQLASFDLMRETLRTDQPRRAQGGQSGQHRAGSALRG